MHGVSLDYHPNKCFILSHVGQASVSQPTKFTPDPEHFPVSPYVQLQQLTILLVISFFFISHLVKLHKSPRERKLHSHQHSTCNHKGIMENYLQKGNLLTFIQNGNPLSSQCSNIQISIKSIRINLTKLSLRRIWHGPTIRKNSTIFFAGKKGNMNKCWLTGIIDYCESCSKALFYKGVVD